MRAPFVWQENRALTLKAENERKTAILIIVALCSIIIGLTAIWNIQKRKRCNDAYLFCREAGHHKDYNLLFFISEYLSVAFMKPRIEAWIQVVNYFIYAFPVYESPVCIPPYGIYRNVNARLSKPKKGLKPYKKWLTRYLRTYIVAVVCAVMTLISFVEKPAIIRTIICSSLSVSAFKLLRGAHAEIQHITQQLLRLLPLALRQIWI